MYKFKKIPDNSNNLVLKSGEFIFAFLVSVFIAFVVIPFAWRNMENVNVGKEFRLSYDYRDDYRIYGRALEKLVSQHSVIIIGDSVIWGMFSDNQNTLSAKINSQLPDSAVGNAAIDGLHPIVMQQLLSHYGSALKNKKVLVYWNPVWLNNSLSDLTEYKDGASVNHPRLVPQWNYRLKTYQGTLAERCNALQEHCNPFYALLHHWRVSGFNNQDFKKAIAENPQKALWKNLQLTISPVEHKAVNGKDSWQNAGIPQQNWPWVMPKESQQWQALQATIKLLESRDNEVMILVGRVNPYMQTKESLKRYQEVRNQVIDELNKQQRKYIILPELPSEEYADASHPLPAGYQRWCDALVENPMLKEFINKKQ